MQVALQMIVMSYCGNIPVCTSAGSYLSDALILEAGLHGLSGRDQVYIADLYVVDNSRCVF